MCELTVNTVCTSLFYLLFQSVIAGFNIAPTLEQEQPRSLSCGTELSQYKASVVAPVYSTPLQYWRQQSTEFPILAQVARRVLCISASSAQSERDFSSVGHTITDARLQLSAKSVESIELVRCGMRGSFLWWCSAVVN